MGVDKRLKSGIGKEREIRPDKGEFLWEMYQINPNSITYIEKKYLLENGYIQETDVVLEDLDPTADKEFSADVNKKDPLENQRKSGEYHNSGRDITSDMWKPESLINHTDEFFHFINSMNYDGFQNKLEYEPLQIYIEQAHNWLSEEDDITNYYSEEEKMEYAFKEIERCRENSLYFLDKYLKLFESDMLDETSMDYVAKPVHEVMAFLFDCGYNQIVGKPRQIAATTTYQALALKRLMTFKNTFVKFITMDVDSAEEILEQKMKFPVSELPDWLRPSVTSDSAKGIKFGRKIKGKKGVRGGANSKFHVVAPSVSAINGGAPSLVLVDEAAYIRMLIKMIMEARPTMFRQNPITKEIQMLRQVIIWGTGGVDEKEQRTKSKAYEELFYTVLDKWGKKEFDFGIVPIFFDWTTRPGMTQKFYEQELRNYTVEGPEKESMMNQFRLTYPSRIEDMFLDSAKTLVPLTFIEQQERAIRELPYDLQPQYGYFEPEYDISQPASEYDDVPYKITGANWIPVEDEYDPRASAIIWRHPDRGWSNRFFMGTDPIASDTGQSNMASAVYDAKLNTITAVVNYRNDDHKVTFLQNLLLGIYYGEDRGEMCRTLVEANIGTNFVDYVESKGYGRKIVLKSEVLPILQGGHNRFGVDNKGNRSPIIINKGYELIHSFGERIFIPDLWKQLRTFTCTVTDSGREVWGTTDPRKYKDDVFFACSFAYICRESFHHLTPIDLKSDDSGWKIVSEYVRNSDGTLGVKQKRVKR